MEKIDVVLHKSLEKTFPSFSQRYERIIQFNGLKSRRVFAGEPDFWENVEAADLFIYRFSFKPSELQLVTSILPVIENEFRKNVFPNQQTRLLRFARNDNSQGGRSTLRPYEFNVGTTGVPTYFSFTSASS